MAKRSEAGRLSREWDELAESDALWFIYSDDPERRGRWQLEEFFATGEREVAGILDQARDLGRPVRHERALDFGCGVGRLTRALGSRFDEAVGVDVSPEMIRRAEEANADRPRCRFVVNVADDLSRFPTGTFDVVYSNKVLQHMSSRALASSYVAELVRVMRADGLLAFQLWTHVPWRKRIQPRRRLYGLLRPLGISAERLRRLGLSPRGRGIGVPEVDVRAVVERAGGRVAAVHPDGEWGLWYYVVKDVAATPTRSSPAASS
jgi:SAM-dependent methyltransferase